MYGSRSDGIHADAPLTADLSGECSSEGDDGALCARVVQELRGSTIRRDGSRVDDGVTLVQVRNGKLSFLVSIVPP